MGTGGDTGGAGSGTGSGSGTGATAAPTAEDASWRGRALSWSPPRRLVGGVLLVAWVAWAIALWVVQPRLVPEATLADDLAAGRVTAYRVVTVEPGEPGGILSPHVGLEVLPAPMPGDDSGDQASDDESADDSTASDDSTAYDGPPLTVGYWVDAPVGPFRVLDPSTLPSDVPTAQVQRLTAAGVTASHDVGFFSPPWQRVQNAGVLLLIITFLVVVLGPRPGRGTRWFWFWLLPGAYLLVVPAFAVLELLRPARGADDTGHPPGRAGRWSGLAGFVLGWVLWAVVLGASTALSERWPLWVVRG